MQEEISQDLWQVRVGDTALKNGLEFGIASGHRISHHHKIRCRYNVLGVKAVTQLDALLPQKVTHGRIDVGVRARHTIAALS